MKASAKKLLSIIKEPKQFIIPIYQRTYSWQPKQCVQLLKDIQAASSSDHGHFVGSKVYFQPNIHTIAEINEYLVIDGQQRLTTITLIIAALVKFKDENPAIEIGTTAKKTKELLFVQCRGGRRFILQIITDKARQRNFKMLIIK